VAVVTVDSLRAPSRFADRLATHFRTPLFREGYALVVSSALTSVLGLVYWVLAARMYSAHAVGVNAALVSAMMFVAGVAQLNLMSALLRFLPSAGGRTLKLVLGAYVVSTCAAAVASVVFVAGVRFWTPGLSVLRGDASFGAWFVVATIAWTVFVLQDSVLTGLRNAVWVPIDNAIHSLSKIVFLVALAAAFPRYGIFASWTLALTASLVVVSVLVFARLIPRHARAFGDGAEVTRSAIARYVAPDYIGSLFWIASMTLLPVIVLQRAGAAENAYFSLAQIMALPLFSISASTGAALIVSASPRPSELASETRQVLVQTARLVVPATAVMVVGAPIFLRLFGHAYSANGTHLLRLLALSSVPFVANAIYVSVARVRRAMSHVVLVLGAQCVLVIGLTFPLLDLFGIVGVGLASLAAQMIVAMAISVPRLVPLLRDVPDETRRRKAMVEMNVTAPAPRDVWADLFAQDESALVMQSPEWFDCLCASREYSDASRLYEFPNGCSVILPLVHRSVLGGRATTAHSLPSLWGFGGVVADRPVAPDDLCAVFEDLARSPALRTTLLSNPDQAAEWAAGAPAWVRATQRTAHVLDLDGGFERVWSERFPGATRTKIRKAERSGVVAQRGSADFLPVFYDVYVRWSVEHAAARGIPARIARTRAERRESLDKFLLLSRALGERFRIWVAFVDGLPAAALILLVHGEDAIYWRGYSDRALTRTSRATDLLQSAAIEDACSAGCVRYHMGESSNVASLMHFKERFGARPVPYAQYRLEKLPLTPVEDAWDAAVHRVERGVLALRRS
jgi:O-antigen/teichoic acid export membrane protein